VQRDAVGALVNGVDHLAGRRQARVQDQCRDERGLVVREGLEAELLGEPLGEQPCSPFAVERAERQLVGAVHAQHQQRSVLPDAGELADDLDAQFVGPLQVLERKEGRPVDRRHDQLRDVTNEQTSRPEVVGPAATLDGEQGVPKLAEAADIVHGPREVEHGSQGDLAILRCEIALGDPEAGRLRLAQDGPQQAGLSDTGFAGQQQEVTLPGRRLGDPAVGQAQQFITADEERAQERADGAHWREV
jgi:hypothetical protein